MAPDWRGLYPAVSVSAERRSVSSRRLNCFVDEMGSVDMSAGPNYTFVLSFLIAGDKRQSVS